MKLSLAWLAAAVALLAGRALADEAPAPTTRPYTVLKAVTVGGPGRWDYITLDSDARRLYVPRSDRVTVYDADSLAQVGEIHMTPGVHGVALNPDTRRGFTSNGSGNSVTMFDTKTLQTVQTIAAEGRPDGIMYDPFTHRVFVFSHQAPNVTVIGADGSVAGKIDLGGAPEQAVSDGNGHVYVNIESNDEIVALDPKAMAVTDRWKLGDGKGPTGLSFDAKNRRLFSCCGNQKMVILDADSGAIVATEPIGKGVDAATFDPQTMEAFSSNRDGTLTVVKENSPASFVVEQNVATRPGARTCALDATLHRIFLVTAEFAPPSTEPAEAGGGRSRPQPLPNTFMIVVVGRGT